MRFVSSSRVVLFVAAWIAAPLHGAFAENWPAWRGPAGTGVTTETELPLQWDRETNVVWRTPLPEKGNSTPIVWGDRIFVNQSLEAEGRRTLMCFDRNDGSLLWQSGVDYAAKDPTHPTNPYNSASPVTDGERVITWFGSAGVVCYDFDGRELWRRDLGPVNHEWGNGSSPIITGDLCILNYGPGNPSFVVALDKQTGNEVWRRAVPHERTDDGPTGLGANGDARDSMLFGSWSTPLVIDVDGRKELILTLPGGVIGCNPQTGRELWICKGLADLVYTSPVWDEESGVLIALGGYHGAGLALRPGGSGDVTATHRLWHQPRSKLRLGTGVIHDGHLYTTDTPGIAECIRVADGETVWRGRLSGAGGRGEIWSSAVLSGDRVYLMNQSGETFVFRASPDKLEVLAKNHLDEASNSSVVPAAGQLILRTHEALWCIGTAK